MERRNILRLLTIAALFLSLPVVACHHGGVDSAAAPSTRAFLFGVRGVSDAEGQFVALASDPTVLAKLDAELALPVAQRFLHITGPIARGNGGHNLSWSWHFVPEQWDLVEISAEVCDGTPRSVEADLDYWVDKVGFFCPWSSFVEAER